MRVQTKTVAGRWRTRDRHAQVRYQGRLQSFWWMLVPLINKDKRRSHRFGRENNKVTFGTCYVWAVHMLPKWKNPRSCCKYEFKREVHAAGRYMRINGQYMTVQERERMDLTNKAKTMGKQNQTVGRTSKGDSAVTVSAVAVEVKESTDLKSRGDKTFRE